jgi:hypothetical protein
MPNITRTADVSHSYSVHDVRFSSIRFANKGYIVSKYFGTDNRRPFVYRKKLFTDESCFTRTGITNIHSNHVRSDEIPHAIQSQHQQQQFYIGLWGGIIGDCFIGPHMLLIWASGCNYPSLFWTHISELLEDMSCSTRFDIGFSTVLLHYITVVKWWNFCLKIMLDARFFADVKLNFMVCTLTWLDSRFFFLWVYLKTEIFTSTICNRDLLWRLIRQYRSERKSWNLLTLASYFLI